MNWQDTEEAQAAYAEEYANNPTRTESQIWEIVWTKVGYHLMAGEKDGE